MKTIWLLFRNPIACEAIETADEQVKKKLSFAETDKSVKSFRILPCTVSLSFVC